MNPTKLSRLYQMAPSPWKVLDKLLFAEPLVKKLHTFEMKSLLISYGISAGVFFDKRANPMTRKFLVTYHIGGSLIIYTSCILYFRDLKIYDVEAIILGVIPIMMTTMKMAYAFFFNRLWDVIEHILDFFVNDHNHADPQTSDTNGCIRIKKWVILVTCIFFGFHFTGDLLFDPESDTRTDSFTRKPYVSKFFPIWCPFENALLKSALSLLQDAIVLPELLINVCGSLAIFISVIVMHNKFEVLIEKLKLLSQRTFERIENLDKRTEEAISSNSGVARFREIKRLEEERVNTMEQFYNEFISYVARFQQLQRIQLSLKKLLKYYCSLTYCVVLSCTIGFGFIFAEVFSNSQFELGVIFKMLIWFLACAALWLLNCCVGEVFSKQSDSFAEEVYSMPWYNFSPKQRKTVFTLLTIIQKPIYLRALNLVNVTKEMFPDWLNTVYSYVQILQTFQNLKHRNI